MTRLRVHVLIAASVLLPGCVGGSATSSAALERACQNEIAIHQRASTEFGTMKRLDPDAAMEKCLKRLHDVRSDVGDAPFDDYVQCVRDARTSEALLACGGSRRSESAKGPGRVREF